MAESEWVAEVNAPDFQEKVIERSRTLPVVVDFWAPWCGPCRQLGPLLERLTAEANGAFALAKVNVDDNQHIAGEFGVEGIPAVFAVRDGEVVDSFVGLLPEPQLKAWLAGLTRRVRTPRRNERVNWKRPTLPPPKMPTARRCRPTRRTRRHGSGWPGCCC